MRNENDRRKCDENRADVFAESDFGGFSVKDSMWAYNETSEAIHRSLMQLLPLLCRKYKLAEPMMLLVFAQATRACSIAIEMERIGLTEQEADQCIDRMNAVVLDVEKAKQRRIEE